MELTDHDKEILQAIIDGKRIEYNNPYWGRWIGTEPMCVIADLHIKHSLEDFRIKPETIMIGDMEVPRPLDKEPEEGTQVFIVDPYSINCGFVVSWEHICTYRRWFRRGLVQKTRQGMIQHATALIKVSGGSL